MKKLSAAFMVLGLSTALAQKPNPPTATNEGGRAAAQYYSAKPGTTWTYGTREGQTQYVVDGVEGWKAAVHFKLGKRSAAATWRIRDGVWWEKLSGVSDDRVLLPATVSVGTHWKGASSFERGGKDTSDFEVVALDAMVEGGPDGKVWEKCLAVLESSSGPSSDPPLTHYYALNVGKVAVRAADTWLLKLVEFRPGRSREATE